MTVRVTSELRELRARAALYDELVEQLADTERQLEQVRRSFCRDGIDPAWREIANALARAAPVPDVPGAAGDRSADRRRDRRARRDAARRARGA